MSADIVVNNPISLSDSLDNIVENKHSSPISLSDSLDNIVENKHSSPISLSDSLDNIVENKHSGPVAVGLYNSSSQSSQKNKMIIQNSDPNTSFSDRDSSFCLKNSDSALESDM